MKKIKYISLIMILTTTILSCKKDLTSEGVSRITYYPTFTVTGDQALFIKAGTPFTDPGIKANAGTTELPVTTEVSSVYFPYSGSSVDVNKPNLYNIVYSATNADGFKAHSTRNVYVVSTGDLVNSLEGLYTSTVVRNGVVSAQYQDLEYVMIIKTGANTYNISDGIGGYYAIGRNYGALYFAAGETITANDISSNDFTFSGKCIIGGFGTPAVDFTSMQVDAIAKTIHLQTVWATTTTYKFDITLTQVSL